MDRNTEISPRVDDQLKHEASGFVTGSPVPNRDDDKLQEEIGALEPGRRPLTAEPAGGQPSIDEAQAKADFARWFRPSELPSTAAALGDAARREGAPEWIVAALDRLDGEQRFDTIGAAWDTVSSAPRGEDR